MALSHTYPSVPDIGQVTRRLEIDSLRLLAVVCQEGSYAKAARIEPLTASAISKRIADLERAVGCVLLERSNSGVRATVAGEVVLSKWAEVATSLSGMLSAADRQSLPDHVQLSVVSDEEAARFLVFDCLGHIDALEDAAKIAVSRSHLQWLPVEFEKMGAHAAIWALGLGRDSREGRLAELAFEKFRATRCYRFSAEVCMAVVRSDHPLAALGLISGDDLDDYDVACAGGTFAHYVARMAGGDTAAALAKVIRPSWSHQVSSTLEYLESVPCGAVALLPTSARYVMHRYPNLRALTLTEDHGCTEFGCVLRDDAWLSDRLKLLERLVGSDFVAASPPVSDSTWGDSDFTGLDLALAHAGRDLADRGMSDCSSPALRGSL